MPIEVFFATNRNRLVDQNGSATFGAIAAPDVRGLAFGTAQVDGVRLEDPGQGVVSEAKVVNFGAIGPELQARLLAGDRDVFVFVHGAANTFVDSIQRAAFNVNWINQSPGRETTVLVFSWPATHYDLWDIAADLSDYHHDQRQAAASEVHFVEFLQALYRLHDGMGARRLSLLAHSMGNHMLGFGVERWFSTPRQAPALFDAVVLAAADEPATTLAQPNGQRLSDLWLLGPNVSVYSSREDVLMLASLIANHDFRLGYDGPPNRADTQFFPPDRYAFFDCTDNDDYTNPLTLDRSHQYYRQSATVRADIARVLKGLPAPPGSREYHGQRNLYTLPTVAAAV